MATRKLECLLLGLGNSVVDSKNFFLLFPTYMEGLLLTSLHFFRKCVSREEDGHFLHASPGHTASGACVLGVCGLSVVDLLAPSAHINGGAGVLGESGMSVVVLHVTLASLAHTLVSTGDL